MIELGTRIYVKALATLMDIESDQVITVSANAREEETKKGMDSSQITGSTSSYARKYALNGMFAIDDTKDSDSTNTHGKEETSPKSPANAPVKEVEKATQSDIIDLQMVLSDEEIKKVLAYYKVSVLSDLPKAEVVKMVQKKRSAK
jgi:DNA-directed RNA polymerase subunit H (RpoH/RPB5)